MKQSLLLMAALCLAGIVPAHASEKDATVLPPRLVDLLNESGLEYSIDSDGEASLLFEIDEERTQLVWIRTDLTPMGDESLFHVYSTACETKGDIPRERALWLLSENPRLILGAWSILRDPGAPSSKRCVVLSLELPDSIDAGQLKTALVFAASTADELEKNWTDTDRF